MINVSLYTFYCWSVYFEHILFDKRYKYRNKAECLIYISIVQWFIYFFHPFHNSESLFPFYLIHKVTSFKDYLFLMAKIPFGTGCPGKLHLITKSKINQGDWASTAGGKVSKPGPETEILHALQHGLKNKSNNNNKSNKAKQPKKI